MRSNTRQKRKTLELAEGKGESSKKVQQAHNPAQILNFDGLIEIQVEYDHCSRLAHGLGFRTAQIIEALEADNQDRREQRPASHMDPENSELGEPQPDCEIEPEEELGSDME